jgi:hypothetical protein
MATRTPLGCTQLLYALGAILVSSPLAYAGGWSDVPDAFDRSRACTRATCGDIFTWPNSPSTPCQCMGCGVGAGYHADLVYGAVPTWRCNHHGVQWLAHSPRPQAADCFAPSMLTYSPVSHPAQPLGPPRLLHHHQHELLPDPSRQQLFAPPSYESPTSTPSRAPRPQPPMDEPESPSDAEPSASRLPMPAF